MTSPATPVEIEVKLAVTRPRAIARRIRRFDVEALAGFEAADPARHLRQTDVYVDTAPPGKLAQRGMRARLRREGRRVTLALKRTGVERAGITTRMEVEAPATPALDPARWPPSEARDMLMAATGGLPLVEIARLRQHRLTRLVRSGGTIVELTLDRVDALVDGAVMARRHELELELKSGEEAALARLAGALAGEPGTGAAAGSKLAFGLSVR